MKLTDDNLYQALKTHDARFDGRFFVGVSSTKIYCRPICTVKTPKRENCTFYTSAAGAEAAGFRPCLRCRPELAPGNASVDATRRLAHAAATLIEDGCLADSSFGELADRLGVTDRHLRRSFHGEFGVAPVEFLQTQRLLLSKRLLTDTRLPVTEVAMAAGFGSLRRFNALFKERYRMSPSDLRKKDLSGSTPADQLRFELSYRPPYAWQEILGFLAYRAVPGIELVTDDSYARTVRIDHAGATYQGWFEVSQLPKKRALVVLLSASLSKVIPRVLGRVKAIFDLTSNPDEVTAQLGTLAETPGLRLPGTFDGFELAIRAVLGQQITVRAAQTLVGRFAHRLGHAAEQPKSGLEWLFPSPTEVLKASAETIGKLGIVRSRVGAIRELAKLVEKEELRLDPSANLEETLKTLQNIAGIGEWTAQYIAMRALNWPDAFPHTDYAVKKALGVGAPRLVLERAAKWSPWRAYAVMHLWQSLVKEKS